MTDKIYMAFAKGTKADESEMKNIAATIALSDIDSRLGIEAIIAEHGKQKGVEILSCLRKEAHKYKCVTLNRFVVDKEYLLDENGNVAVILPETFEDATDTKSFFDVMYEKDFREAGGLKLLHTKQYL